MLIQPSPKSPMKTLAEHLFGIEAGTTHRAHALDSDTDSGAYLARETARAVMDQDAPLFVCEADGQFLVSGEDTAVLINPDGEVSIRSKDNQGKVSESNMNYDENELYEQPVGYGPDFKPLPRKRKRPAAGPDASKKNYFEDGFDEDDIDEAKGSALNVAKNALGIASMTLDATVARLKKEARPDAQGRLTGPLMPIRNANFFRVAKDALNTIVKSGDEKLAQAAMGSSNEKHMDVRGMVATLAQANAPGWRKKAQTYKGMLAGLGESLEESQPHAGAQMHRSKRNKLTDPRGPQSETNPRDYPTDTSYGHGNSTPQFHEDWEISETEWLQFWLDEVVENAYTPDMKPVIQAIDAAVEEEDFDTFDIEAARLAEMAGVLDEYKKMSGGSRAKMMKSRKKPKTGKQKMALKKRRLKYKKNKSKMLRASRKYRKKVGSRMASDDSHDNLMEGESVFDEDMWPRRRRKPSPFDDIFDPWKKIPGGGVGWPRSPKNPWEDPYEPWDKPYDPFGSGGFPGFGSGGPGGRSAGPLRQSDDNYSNLTEQPAGYGPDFKPLDQGSVGWGPPNGGNGGNGGIKKGFDRATRRAGGLSGMAQVLGGLTRGKNESYDQLSEQQSLSVFGELTYQGANPTPVGDTGGPGYWGGLVLRPFKKPKNPWIPTGEVRLWAGKPHGGPGDPSVGGMVSLSWWF